jgi:hypothetical protein
LFRDRPVAHAHTAAGVGWATPKNITLDHHGTVPLALPPLRDGARGHGATLQALLHSSTEIKNRCRGVFPVRTVRVNGCMQRTTHTHTPCCGLMFAQRARHTAPRTNNMYLNTTTRDGAQPSTAARGHDPTECATRVARSLRPAPDPIAGATTRRSAKTREFAVCSAVDGHADAGNASPAGYQPAIIARRDRVTEATSTLGV